jgi:hypothetical protein
LANDRLLFVANVRKLKRMVKKEEEGGEEELGEDVKIMALGEQARNLAETS